MNTTLVFLHLSRLSSHSPFLTVTNTMTHYSISNLRVECFPKPLLVSHNCRFSVILRQSLVTHAHELIQLEHRSVISRYYFEDDLRVYDCVFQQVISGARGGAICVSADSVTVDMDRVTFSQCSTQETGGAIWIYGDSANLKHIRMIDCEASNSNNFVINCTRHCIIDCSTAFTDISTKVVDDVFRVEAAETTFQNFNITKSQGTCIYQASKTIHIVYCTFQECSGADYVLSTSPIEHDDVNLLMQFSNVYGNTAGRAIVKADSRENILHTIAFLGTSGTYYVLSNEEVILSYCAFDVPEDAAIEPETYHIADGCQWNEQDEDIHHLWIGNDSDYGTLPTRISETYIPSITKSMYVSNTKFFWQETATFIRSYSHLPQPTSSTPTSTPSETSEGSKIIIGVGIPIALLVCGCLIWLALYSIRRLGRANDEPMNDDGLLA